MLQINAQEWILRATLNDRVRHDTAKQFGIRPSHLQALSALYSLIKRELRPVSPGELYASTPISPTLLRSYVRVLVLGEYVVRYRITGRPRLRLTGKGNHIMLVYASRLQRAVEQYLAA